MDINDLYARLRQGNDQAENALFQLLSESFGLFVRRRVQDRLDGEEIVQNALGAIAQNYRKTEIETSFSSWAYRILMNKLRDYYRQKHRRGDREQPFDEGNLNMGVYSPNPRLLRKLEECLRQISKNRITYARVLNLRYQGHSTEEICKAVGLTRNSVYVALSRARKMLRECLNRKEPE